jgi:endogenous inhibitor of DNA gyrase (YacG/DUF329 family)
MAIVTVKCPKCGNMCDFNEGRLFGFCNKCGSKLERGADNVISVYDKNTEKDEAIMFAWDRFDVCTNLTVPTRSTHDIESLGYEIERMMDEFMTFAEVLKDIYSSLDSRDEDDRHRVCELCYDMSDRIFMQFEQFLREYNDFGMYDELKKVRDAFTAQVQKLSVGFAATQRDAASKYWDDRKEEYEALTKALKDAKEERARVPFMDFERKWALDAEIERLQNELTKAR